MSEPPSPKGPGFESDGDLVALEVVVAEEVRLPVPPKRSAPPRPATRSAPPRPTPRSDFMEPITAMPIIALGPLSRDGDGTVEVGTTGFRRSSLPPPPIGEPSTFKDIEEEVTPQRMRAPADSLVQAIPSPRPPMESDPNVERPSLRAFATDGNVAAVDAEMHSTLADDAGPEDDPPTAPDMLPDEIVDSEPRSSQLPTDPGEVENEGPRTSALQASPDNHLSEPPPEVDPADVEIHEIAGHLQMPARATSKQPPPVRLPLPMPLYARGAELAAAVQAQQTAETPRDKRARYWWDEMFGDDFLRTMDRLTHSQIKTEVSFIEESLGVQKGAIVLDLACGAGRHAVEMAVRGYNVVGYDLSVAMLARAADEAQERDQKLNFLHGDMRDMGFEEMFDGVYCWSTSFGYFDDEKNQLVAQKIHRALRKGGMLLLDLANRDFVTQRQPSLVWFEGDGCICMDEMRVDFITSRLRVKRMVILEDGRTRELDYSIRLYTLHELGRMLHDVGFKVTEVSGHPATPGVFMGADSPRLIVLAEKA